MGTYALVVFFHVGMMGDGNSNATTVIHGFQSKSLCEEAIRPVKRLAVGVKSAEAVCVKVSD